MSADSWYFGPAFGVGIRSKAWFRIYGSSKFFRKKLSTNVGPRSEQLVFNSVLHFKRVTHFRLCLLETQVTINSSHSRVSRKSDRNIFQTDAPHHGGNSTYEYGLMFWTLWLTDNCDAVRWPFWTSSVIKWDSLVPYQDSLARGKCRHLIGNFGHFGD